MEGSVLGYEEAGPAKLLTKYQVALAISVGYLSLVVVLGPRFMKGRKPYELKWPILVYNLVQIWMNLHMFYLSFSLMGIKTFDYWTNVCNPVSAVNDDPDLENKISFLLHYFYVNKITDLLDTIFYTLRKKESQITFHHIFHHSSVIIAAWLTCFEYREETSVQLFAINMLVHAFTYVYYLLSGLGSSERYQTWRKCISMAHVIELLVMLAIVAKMKWNDCNTHPWFYITWLTESSILFVLFSNFYRKKYLKAEKEE